MLPGTTTLLTFDTTNARVQIGTGAGSAAPGLLVLDTDSTTGDPATGGVNGSMYYNSADSEFRCYRNGAWENCGARQDTMDFVAVADPAAPPAGEMYLYSKSIAGRIMPKWVGPSGVDTPFQASLGFNGIRQVSPGTGATAATAMTAFGTAFTSTGTQSQIAMTTGALIKNKMRMVGMATSTTAGNVVGNITPNFEAKIDGGFFFSIRFGVGGTIQSGQRQFHGLWASTSIAANNDPTTSTTAKIGIGYALSGTTGNWKIVMASGSAAMAAIDLGATDFAVNNTGVYELVLFCAPGGTPQYRVTNLENGVTQSGTLSSNPPAASTLLAVQNWVTNNATAAASTLLINKWYLESDY